VAGVLVWNHSTRNAIPAAIVAAGNMLRPGGDAVNRSAKAVR
jgi:hypothetical protein